MNINRIFIISLFALSILFLPSMIENALAGGGLSGACCGCSTGNPSVDCNLGSSGMCREFQLEFCEENGGTWQGGGTDCSAPDPCLTPPPGKCTVSSNDISTNLICLCQNQTRRGKDTFKVIQCNNQAQIDDCNKRGGEVKQYINADDSANLFDFDCSETNCLDVCIND